MHLWTVFGIDSIADNKHQNVEEVLIFSHLRTFPNSYVSVYLWKAKSSTGPGTGNRRFGSAIRRDPSQDGKRERLALEVHFTDKAVTSRIKQKVNWHIVRFWRTEVDAAEVISLLCHLKLQCLCHLPLLGKHRHRQLLLIRDYLTPAALFGRGWLYPARWDVNSLPHGRCESPERVSFWRWIFRTGASDFVGCRWPPILSDLPAPYTMETGASFLPVKRPERRAKHSPPSSIEVKKG